MTPQEAVERGLIEQGDVFFTIPIDGQWERAQRQWGDDFILQERLPWTGSFLRADSPPGYVLITEGGEGTEHYLRKTALGSTAPNSEERFAQVRESAAVAPERIEPVGQILPGANVLPSATPDPPRPCVDRCVTDPVVTKYAIDIAAPAPKPTGPEVRQLALPPAETLGEPIETADFQVLEDAPPAPDTAMMDPAVKVELSLGLIVVLLGVTYLVMRS